MANIVIVGRGPAGISAALYTLRAGMATTIIGKDARKGREDRELLWIPRADHRNRAGADRASAGKAPGRPDGGG